MRIHPTKNGIAIRAPFFATSVLMAAWAGQSVLGQDSPSQGIIVTSTAVSNDGGASAGGGGGGFGGSGGSAGGGFNSLPAPAPGAPQIFLRTDLLDDATGKESSWLGVAVSDTTEPLCAQLGLKRGEGLVVELVSSNSPAAGAGLQKNDVLVDSIQLRKLVRMHAEGETVKIEYYRAGKLETVSAKLVKQPADEVIEDSNPYPNGLFQQRLQNIVRTIPKVDTDKINAEVQRAMAEADRAVREASRQSQAAGDMNQRLAVLQKKLGNFAAGGVNLNNNTTVEVKNDLGSVRTVVKKDDTGTYILVADPAKRATVHDADNKLLFDGPVDSTDQQKKVPAEIWQKLEPMLKQLDQNEPPTPPVPPEAPEPPSPPDKE
jgi:hypothetical protein